MVAVLMMSAKLATSGLLKIKVFEISYDVIISVYDVTSKLYCNCVHVIKVW